MVQRAIAQPWWLFSAYVRGVLGCFTLFHSILIVSCPENCLLNSTTLAAAYSDHGVRALDSLAVEGLSIQGSFGVAALDSGFLGAEMEHQVEVTVLVHIFKVASRSVGNARPVGAELYGDS